MEKLELKHILPYLPYELEVKGNDTVAPGVMVSIVSGMPGLLLYEDKDNIEYYELSAIKPLLIPLSGLTQQQWHNVFNAGLLNANPALPEEFLKAKRSVEYHHEAIELCYDHSGNSISYSFDEFMFTSNGIRFNQIAAYQKLYEHHADIHHLIDAGFALNKLDYIKP